MMIKSGEDQVKFSLKGVVVFRTKRGGFLQDKKVW